MKLGLSGKVQLMNASLALQLSHAFLKIPNDELTTDSPSVASPFRILLADALGLAVAKWPGRSHILHRQATTYYIDGAHTPESIEACIEWFQQALCQSEQK